jgi:hypothetical protein
MTRVILPIGMGSESNEFLMTMVLRVGNHAVEDVDGSADGRGAVPLVVARHDSEPALLQRQAWLDAIESPNLALLVNRQLHLIGQRIDIKPDTSRNLATKFGSLERLELSALVRSEAVRFPDATDRAGTFAARPRHGIGCLVGRLVGGSANVSATNTLGHLRVAAGIIEERASYWGRPSTPLNEP